MGEEARATPAGGMCASTLRLWLCAVRACAVRRGWADNKLGKEAAASIADALKSPNCKLTSLDLHGKSGCWHGARVVGDGRAVGDGCIG